GRAGDSALAAASPVHRVGERAAAVAAGRRPGGVDAVLHRPEVQSGGRPRRDAGPHRRRGGGGGGGAVGVDRGDLEAVGAAGVRPLAGVKPTSIDPDPEVAVTLAGAFSGTGMVVVVVLVLVLLVVVSVELVVVAAMVEGVAVVVGDPDPCPFPCPFPLPLLWP